MWAAPGAMCAPKCDQKDCPVEESRKHGMFHNKVASQFEAWTLRN